MSPSLRITEIFFSIQGEARTIGWPTVFIRLTGCPLRCVWCDTAYAFNGGERMDLDAVLEQVSHFPTMRVCVTGGEPLAQPACQDLLRALIDRGYEVSLETSGAFDVSGVPEEVVKVMDLKPPGSGEAARNRLENMASLLGHDQVKMVLRDEADYLWAKKMVEEHRLSDRCEVVFSPVAESLSPRVLAEWILADGLNVRFQVQLHKVLWGDQKGV